MFCQFLAFPSYKGFLKSYHQFFKVSLETLVKTDGMWTTQANYQSAMLNLMGQSALLQN